MTFSALPTNMEQAKAEILSWRELHKEQAAMLRKQDAAIKQLREALQFLLVTAHVSADEQAKAALAATEKL